MEGEGDEWRGRKVEGEGVNVGNVDCRSLSSVYSPSFTPHTHHTHHTDEDLDIWYDYDEVRGTLRRKRCKYGCGEGGGRKSYSRQYGEEW